MKAEKLRINLRELLQEVGLLVSALTNLAEREGDDDSGQQIGDGVIEVSVLREATPPLQQGQQSRPCTQEEEREQHTGDRPALAFDNIHLVLEIQQPPLSNR